MENSDKENDKPKKVSKKFSAVDYCSISKLSRGGKRYMKMKYSKEDKKAKSTWDNIVKKDGVI